MKHAKLMNEGGGSINKKLHILLASLWYHWGWTPAQLTFTCLKSTIETVEKGVKYVQS